LNIHYLFIYLFFSGHGKGVVSLMVIGPCGWL